MIRWERRHFAEHGFVAGVRLFSLATATMAADLKAGTPYVLRCTLPGVDRPIQAETVEGAKTRARTILSEWLDAVRDDDARRLAALQG